MPKALTLDLRTWVLAAISSGLSCRQAAERFGVSAASAIRWRAMERLSGDVRPKVLGGDRRSGRVEARAERILDWVGEEPDITLTELRARLADEGVTVAVSALWRFFDRRRITLKEDGPCRRAGSTRHPEAPTDVVRRATRPRPGQTRLHR